MRKLKINSNEATVIFIDEAEEISKDTWKAISKRKFVFYWWFTGWWDLSLGIHFAFDCPNIEIHLPFGFIRFGWEIFYTPGEKVYHVLDPNPKHGYGIGGR